MFNPNAIIKYLADLRCNQFDTLSQNDAKLLSRVELGLYLLEHLDLQDERVTALWAVLSGSSLPRLNQVNQDGRHDYAIAMTRLLVPFSGRFAWSKALLEYSRLPQQCRTYDALTPDNVKSDRPDAIQLVRTARTDPHRHRNWCQEYSQILTGAKGSLPLATRTPVYAAANKPFSFTIYTRQGKQRVNHKGLKSGEIPADRYTLPINLKTGRTPVHITYANLELTAAELDRHLIERGQSPQWADRLTRYVNYRAFDASRRLLNPGATLRLDAISHVVGMVGAGKSTLMKLIAAYIALFLPDMHITLVVGDTITVLDIVNELNTLLVGDDPATMQPVAVPLIGRTTRERHLNRFYNSVENPATHWALRWLHTECLLLDIETVQKSELKNLPAAGNEPCNRLHYVADDGEVTPKSRKCPLFHRCPSHQLFHDLPAARITVTTPGAMAKSRIPSQVNPLDLTYGEFMYLHADVVIMDEVDTIVEWFDNVYAEVLDLWGKDHAIFNRADSDVTNTLQKRWMSSGERRWSFAARDSVQAIVRILEQLREKPHSTALEQWLGQRYFTAFNLSIRLARRFIGRWDWDTDFEPDEQATINKIEAWFDDLTDGDPTAVPRPTGPGVNPDEDPVYRLSRIIRGGDINELVRECEDWIRQFLPDIAAAVVELNRRIDRENAALRRKAWHHPHEDVRTLAQKLALVLMVMLLDHNLRIIFYEDYNRPPEVDAGTQFYSGRSRGSFGGLLPIPPTGRIFGTYYASTDTTQQENPVLSRFEYRNIGRWYLLHFDSLLADIGIVGPHVLALSGTSWLPDSTRWHFDVPPQGIMVAPDEKRRLIRDKSHFRFLPQRDSDNLPLNVSGSDDIDVAVVKVAKALVQSSSWTLQQELDRLAQLADDHPEWWRDRERLLLLTNSYSQSEAVGKTLQDEWHRMGKDKTEIYYLSSGDAALSDEQKADTPTISRGEIEKFAQKTHGKILVAPMSAIGRGYNILNREIGQDKKAAFGAIYFLIRPMPHPYDIQALAGELNARALQWSNRDDIWRDAGSTVESQALAFRRYTKKYWTRAEMRIGYRSMGPASQDTLDNATNEFERQMLHDLGKARLDLAASTLGKFVQAAGRLVRGGVPFHAFFVDAKWAPNSAAFVLNRSHPDEKPHLPEHYDTEKTSLLVQMSRLLARYVDESATGKTLYEPFEALLDIEDLCVPQIGETY